MTVHVIGAGIAGLACAVRLARAGANVALHEQNRVAGGRCRSYFDRRFGRALDTGIHLAFTHHRHLHGFLAESGAADQLVGPDRSSCRFVAVEGRSWTLRPNAGPIPWWLMVPGRAPPERGIADAVALARLAVSGPDATVAGCVPADGLSYRYLWEPFTVACLNTPPARASAHLFWRFVRDGLRDGADLYHQRFARDGLSASFIEPALATLRRCGGAIHFRRQALGLDFAGKRLVGVQFAGHRLAVGPADAVVLALPPAAAGRLVPGLVVPREASAIVTAHFALDPPATASPELTCVIEGRSFWLLARGAVATATVGAADDLLAAAPGTLAQWLWSAAAPVLGRDPGRLPAWRVLKFRNGTFAHTPSDVARRAAHRTRWDNLFLAGDWTATGVPATVDGAALSGHSAAAAALAAA